MTLAKRLHKIDHNWDVFPVMPGRGTLRQLVRDVVNPYRFFVVYDTYSSSAPDGSSYSGGNTSFIEFDLEKQIDNVLAQIPLKEDMDDSDLLFTSIVTVESIPSTNRHCVTHYQKKDVITCFVLYSQYLSIYSYMLTEYPASIKHIPLYGDSHATLNPKNVFLDTRYAFLAIVELTGEVVSKARVYRIPLDWSDDGIKTLDMRFVRNKNVLLSKLSSTHMAIIYELTKDGSLTIDVVSKETMTVVESVSVPNVYLLTSEKSHEFITRERGANTTLSFLVLNNVSKEIQIVQVYYSETTPLELNMITIENSARLDSSFVSYAFVIDELVIYRMVNFGFVYYRVTYNETHASVYDRDSFNLPNKKYIDLFSPVMLLTVDDHDYFVALQGSLIRLFKDAKTRSSTYDFSQEDSTMNVVHGSVIKNDTLAVMLTNCLFFVGLNGQSYTQIYRVARGGSQSTFATIVADEREDYPYIYLTYDSEKNDATKFLTFSLTNKTVLNYTTGSLIRTKNGLFHNGLVYYQSDYSLVEFDPARNTVTYFKSSNCLSSFNFLHPVDNRTLLSLGWTICNINLQDITTSGNFVNKTVFEPPNVLEVNFWHYSAVFSRFLLFQYDETGFQTKITQIGNYAYRDLGNFKISDTTKHTLSAESRAVLDYRVLEHQLIMVFNDEKVVPITTVWFYNTNMELFGKIENLPIHIRTVHQLRDGRIFLVGDRSRVISLTVSIPKENQSKSTWYIPLIIVVGAFGVIIIFAIPYAFCMYQCHRIRKRKRLADELEERLLNQMELDMTTSSSNRSSEWDMASVMVPIEEIKFTKRINEGASGVVYLGSWKGAAVAIKRFKVDDEEAFIKEVSILYQLRHPYLLTLYGASIDDHGHNYIITQFAQFGSLDDVLYKKKITLRFSQKIAILSQIAQAITYLHKKEPKKIIHRDLKPQNILLHELNEVRICDFGVSKAASTNTMTSKTFGTLEYMAPELLLQLSKYDEKVDVYSFGIIMHELFIMKKPFSDMPSSSESSISMSLFALGSKIIRGERPFVPFDFESEELEQQQQIMNQFSKTHQCNLNELPNTHYEPLRDTICLLVKNYFRLCARCWDDNPENRPSFAEIETLLKDLQQFGQFQNVI